ncbi:MAG: transglutaminase family protein [Alphaproteobacteria bacterium]|nr:transglutaminase family protein [Alphaproteobacteria bacterium]
MSIKVALTHRTTYTYDRDVTLAPQVIRLRPAPHSRTGIISYSLTLEPEDHFLNWQQDPFGNFLARMVASEPTRKFSVTVDLVADMAIINPFDFFIEESARDWPFTYEADVKEDLQPYLAVAPAGPELAAYMRELSLPEDATTIDVVVALNARLEKDIKYLIRMEPGVQTPEETLQSRSGSCRDSAWLLVHILRQFGLAARFVSGYLIQLTADVKPLDGPSGPEVDFTDLHAWTEVYLPGAGWVGLDPTSGLLASEGHIPLAATPSPSSAAPISGAHTKAEVEFDFEMSITRIAETPRVTKPYSDEQWQAIQDLGDKVDERLLAGDVRLTMGGEPTFVSVDDVEAGEWNNEAVGPTKRKFAEELVRRLAGEFAPGGLMHFGQGKWYPGEQLPRWAFACYWRRDGEPLWERTQLIDKEVPVKPATIDVAERFTAELCQQLGLPKDSGLPAYEDAAHFALVEQKLPINLTVEDNKLDDEAERQRVVKAFERGLGKPVGYVLPVQSWQSKALGRRWATERWSLRRGRLFLVPGDSPVGLRLPLGGLTYLSPVNTPSVLPDDPMSDAEPLPERRTLLQERQIETLTAPPNPATGLNEISGAVRTAMALEPRDGHLCIFMPPLPNAADYAALVAAIEETAAKLDQPVHIEGYEPSFDSRLNVIKVTPDPGVIEVNIHPSENWRQAVETTERLYEEAFKCRLGTDKFMVDGRHSGTGGGNHIVVGGSTPQDSPFLRRPDLLASLITYWQHHPSLSYLFSGLFIGPTSQAPRFDEARHEGLYEMEIALAQVPGPDAGQIPLWLVDRLFRNLLIDVSGNTHRAEICIDKLYSPDSPTGRLGLVEFRSFEMPPHARMSLAQQLLLRALIARFWEQPYKGRLVRWGTDLHDRFMLPHFVWQDFVSIIDDLRDHGFAFDADWFAAHFEFRFPFFGKIDCDGINLELRGALEPWHVMGEQAAAGGTARYVDSSLERLQVKVSGLVPDRHVVVCGGHRVPLRDTGTNGEFVAGVRYRAWQPPMCLHPTIGIHTPLVFDIVDTWSSRALGGCRYHVAHPGGKYFDTMPVNAYEAESRRHARFEPRGHTPGRHKVPPARPNPDYPVTLDLRMFK